jgi:hypothetical protein
VKAKERGEIMSKCKKGKILIPMWKMRENKDKEPGYWWYWMFHGMNLII